MKHFKAFQGLRTIACLIVFFSHCNELLNIHSGRLGAVGVEIFIVLSGFLVEYCYRESNKSVLQQTVGYIKRKVVKFYWLHIVTMFVVLSQVFVGWIFEIPTMQEIKECICKVIANIFLIQSWIPDSAYYLSLNAVAWYLSTSVVMYLCTPVLHMGIHRIKSKIHKILWIICIYAGQLTLANCMQSSEYLHAVVYIHPLVRIWDYVTGMLLGAIAKERKEQCNRLRGTVSETICIVYLFVCLFSGISDAYYYVVLSAPMAWSLIMVFSQEAGVISGFLSTRVMMFLGNISLEMFMIHLIVIRYWEYVKWLGRRCLRMDIPGGISVVCVFIISVTAAWILHVIGTELTKRKRSSV